MSSRAFGKSQGQTVEEYMMSFDSVAKWLNGIKHGAATPPTKLQFSWCLYHYCKHVNADPDTLLREREREFTSKVKKVRERGEDRLRGFFESYKGKSTKSMIGGAVRSFYAYHRLALQERGFSYKHSGPMDYIPTQEDNLKMYLKIDELGRSTIKRDKAIFLTYAETGLRPQTLAALKYKHIKDEFEKGTIPMAINVDGAITKAGITSVSFLLQDAREAIKEYLGERVAKGGIISPESPLFLSLEREDAHLQSDVIIALVHKVGQLAGLPVTMNGQKRFRSYCLRKNVQTVLEGEPDPIPLNWVDYLMNHQPRGADASSYSKPSLEKLRTAYNRKAKELVVLPEYLKSLDQNPTRTIDYEALKKTLAYLPCSPDKMLERRKLLAELDQDTSLDVAAKYDKLFQAVKHATIELRFGEDTWMNEVVSAEEAERLINAGEAKWESAFPIGNKVVIRRKKRIQVDEDSVHQHFETLPNGEAHGFSEMKQIELQSQKAA